MQPSSSGEKPLGLMLGQRKLMECLECSAAGLAEGEPKNVRIASSQAVEDRNPELVYAVPRGNLPELREDLKIESV